MVSKMNDSNKNYVNEIRNNYIVNRVLIIYKWMIKRKNSLNFIWKKKIQGIGLLLQMNLNYPTFTYRVSMSFFENLMKFLETKFNTPLSLSQPN